MLDAHPAPTHGSDAGTDDVGGSIPAHIRIFVLILPFFSFFIFAHLGLSFFVFAFMFFFACVEKCVYASD